MKGWISIHRKLKDHWVFQKDHYFKAWITIIMEVNHQDKKVLIHNELIECNVGQSLNSLQTWTKIFGKNWTIQKTRTFLKLLEKDSMINIEGLPKTTRLSVCNYDSYQNREQTNNTQLTNKQQTNNKQITTNNNVNKENNKKIPCKHSENIKEILTYLNNKLGSKFRTANGLKARLTEGFTVIDAKKVIDIKFAEWIADEKMRQYLRPDTLFGTKFDSYLNQESQVQQAKAFNPIDLLN